MSEDGADEDGILDPEDLDVRTDERVVELDENRFFVSLSDRAPDPTDLRSSAPAVESEPERGSRSEPAGPPADQTLRDRLGATDGTYAIAAAVRTDAGTTEHVVGTNNVAETFEAFCRWYADEVGDGRTPPEEVVRILLRESDLEV